MVPAGLTRFHLPAVALIVLGLATVGFAGIQLYGLSQPSYSHGVVSIDAEEVPEGEEIRGLKTFSDPAREAFLAAVNSGSPHTTREPAPDLTYRSGVVSDENTYIVSYDGSLYRMTTLSGNGPGAGIAGMVFASVFIPTGLLLAAAGGIGLVLDRPFYTVGLLAGAFVAAGFYLIRPLRPGLTAALLTVVTVTVGSWLGAHTLWRSRTEA